MRSYDRILIRKDQKVKKSKGRYSSSWRGNPPQSYGASLAIWDHTVILTVIWQLQDHVIAGVTSVESRMRCRPFLPDVDVLLETNLHPGPGIAPRLRYVLVSTSWLDTPRGLQTGEVSAHSIRFNHCRPVNSGVARSHIGAKLRGSLGASPSGVQGWSPGGVWEKPR